jgi:outer membrane protein assembly factor BamA
VRRASFASITALGALGLALLLDPPTARAERIVEIRVDGNTKTTDETVKLIADIEPGDELSPDVAARVRRDLVSSGLFRDVEVYWEATGGGDGVRLVIVARDKHSWVIAPAFYNQPTNKGGGVGFGENNLFGENKKLLLYGQVATGDSFFIGAYVDPSIAQTRLHGQIDVYLKSGRVFEYAAPTAWRDDPKAVRQSRLWYANLGGRIGVDLWKGVSLDARLRGATVGYSDVQLAEGAAIEDVTGDPTSTTVPSPGIEGRDVSTELIFSVDTRANWYGISSGSRVVATYERALPGLGSDFAYWYAQLSVQRAIRLMARHNLILKGAFGYGEDLPFQQEYRAGGTAQRGWKNDQFRGDVRATANVEYTVPLFTVKGLAVRGLGFADASYVTFRDGTDTPTRDYLPGSDVMGLAPLKTSVGVGTRLYLRQIVLPLLGLDFGYGLERGDYEIYLAIGLTD